MSKDIQLQNFHGKNTSNLWVADFENHSDIIWPLVFTFSNQNMTLIAALNITFHLFEMKKANQFVDQISKFRP